MNSGKKKKPVVQKNNQNMGFTSLAATETLPKCPDTMSCTNNILHLQFKDVHARTFVASDVF